MVDIDKRTNDSDADLPTGFKMTELGPLPEEWEVIRLGDVARFETGKRERGGAQSQGEVFSVGGEHYRRWSLGFLIAQIYIQALL